jgi:membrane protein
VTTEHRQRERTRDETARPEPDEVDLSGDESEHLSKRDYVGVARRAAKKALAHEITDAAAAIAYYSFLALPALLLVAVGVFSLVAGPDAVNTVIDKVGGVVPQQATQLLDDSLRRTTQSGGGVAMISIGGVLALWTSTGAMNAIMRALNRAHERRETRNFFRQRAVALAMLAFVFLAFVLVFGLLVLGPKLSHWIGGLVGLGSAFQWIWWIGEWPILLGGLLLAAAAVLHLGPNVERPRWRFLTAGSVAAVAIWLVGSGAFAFYVANFGSYNKTWGSLAAVIIMLTWIWLSAIALLFGAEINAEAERTRELRRGDA